MFPEMERILATWSLPQIPCRLGGGVKRSIKELGDWVRKELAATEDAMERTKIELAALDWLYELIRRNIKRGRVFELTEVLAQGYADCLGYAKVFNVLGGRFGLDIGVVDVVIDNAGRYVPHPINLLTFSNKRKQLIDPWYGSKNINHRRIGARIKERDEWKIKDIDLEELEQMEEVKPLPQECVDAITCYIRGNRHLERGIRYSDRGELNKAIECYDMAVKLYPENARFYFNRAIAYENKGEREKAGRDYAQALKDESGQIRLLAIEHEEVSQLIELDQMNLSQKEQEIYLRRKGFITGREVTLGDVAKEHGISLEEAGQIISAIEAKLSK